MSLLILLVLGLAGTLGAYKWGHVSRRVAPVAPIRVNARNRAPLGSGFPIVVLASLSFARHEERR